VTLGPLRGGGLRNAMDGCPANLLAWPAVSAAPDIILRY